MKKSVFTLILLWSISAGSPWDLQKCIDYALKNNISFQMQQQELLADSSRLKESKAGFLPNLNGSAGTSVSAPQSGSETRTSYELSSRVMLFDGMQTPNTVKQRKGEIALQETSLEVIRRTITSDVTKAYLNVLYAKENLANETESVVRSEKQVELFRNQFDAGRITKVELSRSKAQLAQDQYAQTQAENDLRTATLNLQQLLELDPTQEFELFFPELNDTLNIPKLPNAHELFLKAAENHPQMEAIKLSVALAELSKKQARGNYSPSLYATGAISTGTSSLADGSYGTQMGDRFTPSVGLSLSIPIFNNRKTRTAVELAEIGITKTKLEQEQVAKDMRLVIEQLVQQIENSIHRLTAAEAQFFAEQENIDGLADQRQYGRISYYSYLIEQDRYNDARTERTRARYTALLNWQLLRIYLGEPLQLPAGFTL